MPRGFRCGLVRSVAIIKPKRTLVHSPFLELVSNEPIVQRQIVAMQRQLAQANLFQSEIRRLIHPVPSLPEQRLIADIAHKQLGCIKQEIDERNKLCLIKSGLQDDLLTGRVRVPETILQGAEIA